MRVVISFRVSWTAAQTAESCSHWTARSFAPCAVIPHLRELFLSCGPAHVELAAAFGASTLTALTSLELEGTDLILRPEYVAVVEVLVARPVSVRASCRRVIGALLVPCSQTLLKLAVRYPSPGRFPPAPVFLCGC